MTIYEKGQGHKWIEFWREKNVNYEFLKILNFLNQYYADAVKYFPLRQKNSTKQAFV